MIVDIMAVEDSVGFSKDELTFLEEPPKEIEIECPICLQVMLNDPHLVSCCGHHFCGTCIKRVKDSNGACPYCKEKEYQTMPDKGHLRIINGLKVNCTNKGCAWKGEFKDLPVHLNKGKREGQCQYEEVTCVHSGCEIKKKRQYLVKHEKDECGQRLTLCGYCKYKDTCQYIIDKHFPQCTQFPVLCPNKCGLQSIPRCNIQTHVTEECPLQSVECEFKWAGCQYTPLRKDLQQHNNDSQLKHMSLLAKECGELKKGNEELKRENEELKQKMTHIHHTVFGDTYPILPVHVPLDGKEIHFYNEPFGHHMSVKMLVLHFRLTAIFTVYKGKFQQPKVTKVVIDKDNAITTLDVWSGCQEYLLKVNMVQKFSFVLDFYYNLQIISVS